MLSTNISFEEARSLFESNMARIQEVAQHMESQKQLVDRLVKELADAKDANEKLREELRVTQEQKNAPTLQEALNREKEINEALRREIEALRHVIPPATKSPISRVRALEKAASLEEINKADIPPLSPLSGSKKIGKGPLRLGKGASHLFTEEVARSPKSYEPSSRTGKTPKPSE